MRYPHPSGDSPVEKAPSAWGQPSSHSGKNLRTETRDLFPQPHSPGHVSVPQVFPRGFPTPLFRHIPAPWVYPQTPGTPYYNYTGYE